MTKLHNVNEINNVLDNIRNKMTFMVMALVTKPLIEKIDKYLYEKYYTLQFLYCIIFVFSLLENNSTCVILSFSFYTEISIELLFILKKYFKKLIFTRFDISPSNSSTTKIIASRFKGISTRELDNLFEIATKLSNINKKYDDYELDYQFIKSILDIDKNSTAYILFREKIIKFNLEHKHIIKYNVDLFNDTINCKLSLKDTNEFEDIILRKQIQILFYWIYKYKVFKFNLIF
jgi:hypothetical protein